VKYAVAYKRNQALFFQVFYSISHFFPLSNLSYRNTCSAAGVPTQSEARLSDIAFIMTACYSFKKVFKMYRGVL
jgi:hypothetical protein